ncbi:hypothetical protein C2134_08380 [Chromobacterium sinusclupearum]|uniref:Lipoprotein n=2 Tax=Pseudomonadota TaxID=1224 RepID=A0A2K4MQM2_9NEIS|nr:hypothetical protein [Chromobacterium sinusclupearum]POA99085.1 hypothetical protein C2134_08380 [Chromobacterium sinusclupearum]
MTMKVLSMANFTRKLLPLLTISVLAACGGGGNGSSSSSTPSQSNNTSAQYHVAGQVQKGPFIFGSNIWISELDDKLSPTGKVYMTQTKDDLGNFGIPGTVGTKLVELTGSGYYMNELTGTLSTAPVTLNAVADLSVSKSLTINLLTTLQAPRLKSLMTSGSDYQSAYTQSRNEVLAVFGIDPAKVDNLGSLFDMRINGTADQDSILLATSAILSQVAQNRDRTPGPDGYSHPSSETAELSHLISTIASDLANNGKLSSKSLQDQLKLAATQIDLDTVRRNVETYYAGRGIKLVAPKFEEWIDKDSSLILPRRLVAMPDLSFKNIDNADVGQVYSSNPIQIKNLKDGQSISIRVTSGSATLIKNNIATSNYTTAKNGDVIQLQDTALGFGQSKNDSVQIGATSLTWKLTSTTTSLMYDDYVVSSGNMGYVSTNTSYIAFQIKPSSSFIAKYAGIDAQPSSAKNFNISIYSDNAGNPGTPLINSSNITHAFDQGVLSNGTMRQFTKNSIQFQLGSEGQAISNGKIYWLVLKTSDASPVGTLAGNFGRTSYYQDLKFSQDGKNWNLCTNGTSYQDTSILGKTLCDEGSIYAPAVWLAK